MTRMNFLAHMFLSKTTPGSMLGNFLGDFVKGNPEGRFPEEIVDGIMNHRRIDQFTDSNAIVSCSKKLISPSRQRFAGVLVDIIYDHFLSRNWDVFSAAGLNEFVQITYQNLENREVGIPQRAEIVVERMIQEDWLRSYGSLEGMKKAFKRISIRVKGENSLCSALEDLVNHYLVLNEHFLRFFPLLLKYSERAD